MSEPSQEKIAEFCAITGATAERAGFFLQASQGDVPVSHSIRLSVWVYGYITAFSRQINRNRFSAFID